MPAPAPTDQPDPWADSWVAYPTWGLIPSPTKDGDGEETGTKQGRLSAKHPAAQTFPAPIKDCIRSRFPGGSLLWADLSNVELRVAAVLSGEPAMLDAFRAGRDLHTSLAIDIWGASVTDRPTFRKIERQGAKHANFTKLNLGSAETLHATLLRKGNTLVPFSLCTEIVRRLDEVRPVLTAWQQSEIDRACSSQITILHPYGQSRTWRGSPSTIRRTYGPTIVNFPIQCHAANLMLAIQKALLPLLPLSVLLCANIHDALLLDCPPSTLPAARSALSAAVASVESSGYWSWLCASTGHSCPLAYEVETVP